MVVGMMGELAATLLMLPDELGIPFVETSTVLAHPVRRKVLALLVEHGEITRTELAERIARDEEVPTESRYHLEILLHHNHLPRLDEELYVEYDPRNGDIVLWEDPRAVMSQLNEE